MRDPSLYAAGGADMRVGVGAKAVVTESYAQVADAVYTPLLRDRARQMGWPEHLASSLRTVVTTGGTFQATGAPGWEDEEYGNPDQPPKPAVNNTLNNHEVNRIVSNHLNQMMSGHVRSVLVEMFT